MRSPAHGSGCASWTLSGDPSRRLDARELVDNVVGLQLVAADDLSAQQQRCTPARQEPGREGRELATAVPAVPFPGARAPDECEVLVLSDLRGPAPIAQTLYRETDASRELRLKLAEERKAMPRFETSTEGKPSKRDRRQIDRLRGRAR